MKKLLILLLFVPVMGFSQGLFKPVRPFAFQPENIRLTMADAYKWQWRIDATVSLSEVVYNTALKEMQSNVIFGLGPAIGIQHFVPTSDIDPTPFNNYGISLALLMGEKTKIALQANLMQYFKLGVTVTPKPDTDIFPVGLFFGGGITF